MNYDNCTANRQFDRTNMDVVLGIQQRNWKYKLKRCFTTTTKKMQTPSSAKPTALTLKHQKWFSRRFPLTARDSRKTAKNNKLWLRSKPNRRDECWVYFSLAERQGENRQSLICKLVSLAVNINFRIKFFGFFGGKKEFLDIGRSRLTKRLAAPSAARSLDNRRSLVPNCFDKEFQGNSLDKLLRNRNQFHFESVGVSWHFGLMFHTSRFERLEPWSRILQLEHNLQKLQKSNSFFVETLSRQFAAGDCRTEAHFPDFSRLHYSITTTSFPSRFSTAVTSIK